MIQQAKKPTEYACIVRPSVDKAIAKWLSFYFRPFQLLKVIDTRSFFPLGTECSHT